MRKKILIFFLYLSITLSLNYANEKMAKSIKVNGANVTGDLDGISEGTFSRYTPQVDGNGDLLEPNGYFHSHKHIHEDT